MTPENSNIFHHKISVSDIILKRESILRGLGYTDTQHKGEVDDLIEEYLIKSTLFLHPEGGFRVFAGDSFYLGKDFFEIDGIHFNAGKIISSQLKKSSSVVLFAVSVGSVIDGLIKKLNEENDLVAAFVVNTIGSEAAEQTAAMIEKLVADEIEKLGWKHTNRFSPGYCGWSVAEQHKLFSLLPPNFIGIKLTESALMTPIKSISGIIGIGPDAEKKDYTCSICNMENCYRRKTDG